MKACNGHLKQAPMKVEKNKIVFAAVLAVILLFLISYAMLLTDKSSEEKQLKETLIPELQTDQKQYNSKLDALNDLKEVRETTAPSIYDERLLDSLGYFDSDYPEKEKRRIVDSIYATSSVASSSKTPTKSTPAEHTETLPSIDSTTRAQERKVAVQELGLAHQLFFAANPTVNPNFVTDSPNSHIIAVVDGTQVVKANSRLQMRLSEDAYISGKTILKNTPVYGFVSFQANRAMIAIETINHAPTSLKAYDFQDGNEGIYIENNFRAEATREVFDDVIQDINIPSLPQVSGITQVLRRTNRNVKVTVLNNYKLLLKAN
jgi:hypothetical protein|tara:strand:- start:3156 stop:4112 length:957 start_codon:yes stop_codon:yes gene_type:complete